VRLLEFLDLKGVINPGQYEFEGEQIRMIEGARFLGVWIEAGLNWRGHIGQVGTKVGQLLGMLGRVRADLDEHLLLSLYNSMVLPHLQYCLMVWGDFEAGRNLAYGETLLKLQKRFVELIAGKGGRYHADPLFSGYGVLMVGDLYRQQLRLQAWKFCNGRFPDDQMATLKRVDESHGYGTRSARSGLVVGSGNHKLVAYRVPAEWRSLTGRSNSW
jgi:hypothetical protein